MESRLGHEFSGVRIHDGSLAAESTKMLGAAAYSVGRHIVTAGGAPRRSPRDLELLAHELTHVVQQGDSDITGEPETVSSPNDKSEQEATNAARAVAAGGMWRPTHRIGLAVHRQAPPAAAAPAAAAATLAGIAASRDSFNNAGAPDPANCAAALPAALGVDGPAIGQNGMELVFRIAGAIPPGTEFEITRTKTTGVWERDAAGVWARLGGWPAGTSDDHHDDDECVTPIAGRIFVVDTPGMAGTLDPTGTVFPGTGAAVSGAATAFVWKLNFAEWVIARNRGLGIGWTPISVPKFHWWHSILSVELIGGVWTRVPTPGGKPNEIALGQTTTTGPVP